MLAKLVTKHITIKVCTTVLMNINEREHNIGWATLKDFQTKPRQARQSNLNRFLAALSKSFELLTRSELSPLSNFQTMNNKKSYEFSMLQFKTSNIKIDFCHSQTCPKSHGLVVKAVASGARWPGFSTYFCQMFQSGWEKVKAHEKNITQIVFKST